jgi:hypothetical protein
MGTDDALFRTMKYLYIATDMKNAPDMCQKSMGGCCFKACRFKDNKIPFKMTLEAAVAAAMRSPSFNSGLVVAQITDWTVFRVTLEPIEVDALFWDGRITHFNKGIHVKGCLTMKADQVVGAFVLMAQLSLAAMT